MSETKENPEVPDPIETNPNLLQDMRDRAFMDLPVSNPEKDDGWRNLGGGLHIARYVPKEGRGISRRVAGVLRGH